MQILGVKAAHVQLLPAGMNGRGGVGATSKFVDKKIAALLNTGMNYSTSDDRRCPQTPNSGGFEYSGSPQSWGVRGAFILQFSNAKIANNFKDVISKV